MRVPPAVVEAYDDSWPDTYRRLAGRISAGLTVTHRLEHVGSTAVPGLAAKPIVDLDVVVATAADVLPATADLATLGYRHLGDLGITGREAFAPSDDWTYHHLYVVQEGSLPLRDHLDLRDFLRSHPDQAQRYGAGKLRLAPLLRTDREAYGQAKRPLVEELLTVARSGGGALWTSACPTQSRRGGPSVRGSRA